jgi:CubicO group peptidase (beta-lactamase class C family)
MKRSIASFLAESCAAGACPGAAWVVGNSETILEQGSVGVLGEGLGPVRPDSIYDLASITKIFVTLALMRQFEEGLLRLEDTVAYFKPGFVDRENNKGDITLLEILTHTSVIPSLLDLFLYAHTPEDMLLAIRRSVNRADSPAVVKYTCEAYILLGTIIAAIDGAPLEEVIRRRVLEPLGLKDSGYKPPPALLDRIAPTEYSAWRGRMVRGQVHDENAVVMGEVSGNAGLFATAGDLARVAAMMLRCEKQEDFLHPATVEKMTTNYTPGRGQHRGLGWLLAGPTAPAGDLMSRRSFGHTGFTGTSIWVDPEYGLYGVLLANRIHPSRENTKFFRVRSIFHNLIILNYGGLDGEAPRRDSRKS